jgi:NADH-quinone oxidoreductase subunit F
MTDRVLSDAYPEGGFWHLEAYLKSGGYEAARKALSGMKPEAVVDEVKRASLRGRGGAGFPAGVKWSFVPRTTDKPVYVCVNADEGEPGTAKDRAILTHNPHAVLEGLLIIAFAVGAHDAYIYIRGEYEALARRLEGAIGEAEKKGFLGARVLGLDFRLDVAVHRGAGAYICGEETALLESIEGRRGEPRLKPPFPALVGLFQAPTVINNVETVACVPLIIRHGADWFVKQGLPRDGGTRVFTVSGAVVRPGLYELPLGTTLRELIFVHAGGLRPGRTLKAVIPGGLSAPLLRADEVDLPLDFDSLAKSGSMLGSAAVIVLDDTASMLTVLNVIARFYAHESCGQCTPCRLGTAWIRKVVTRLVEGLGEARDLDEIVRVAEAIKGRTLCPLGDAAALPTIALVTKFRGELEAALHG